jgi:hypothetical protein
LVIHCSDPRYQPHFREFLESGLDIPHYALIAVPGGPQCLTMRKDSAPYGAGWQWVEVMEKVAQPERIVLIAHSDCRWYLTQGFAEDAAHLCERQIADLQTAEDRLTQRFTAPVYSYYARLRGDRASFERLKPSVDSFTNRP